MKNLKLIGFLVIFASSLTFIQCTSDPIMGPQGISGIDGTDGIDGVNGVNGVDGTASCVACHNNSHREPINESYAMSGHAAGGAVGYAGGRNGCAQCHSNEGYLDYLNTGATNPDGYTGQGPVSCMTCHDQHSTFDFENDGHDFALRSIDAEVLYYDGITVLDFEGTSNNCIACHQPRNSYVIPAGSDPYEITSKRFGPHHGPQSTVLEGILTANIPGSIGYPGSGANGDNTHRTGSSCVSCHMGASTDPNTGMHSFWVTEDSCTACHTNGAPAEVTDFTSDMATLKQLLMDKGLLLEDNYLIPGTYPNVEAQAAWNYRTLLEDKSHGVHNPKLSKALLKNSIEALQ